MIVELPPPEQRAAILQEHAARFPQPFHFTLPVDGDKEDKLTLLLGNPPQDSEAWELAVKATFKPRTIESDMNALVAESIIWPDASTWGGIVRRWPALPSTVGKTLRQKIGGALSILQDGAGEPPDIIKAARERSPGVVWRRLVVDKDPIEVAVQPPSQTVWELFQDEISKRDSACWALALDFAKESVAASSTPISSVFDRWPGAALLVALTASNLAGVAAKAEQGEF